MKELELESRFRAAMTSVAEEVLHREGRRTYDVVMAGAEQFIDEFIDCSHGGGAYCLWMDVSDLYDDPRGPCGLPGAREGVSEWAL